MKCTLNTDMWEDIGVEYIVHCYNRRENSSATTLELELPDGTMITKVVAFQQIDWIEDENYYWTLSQLDRTLSDRREDSFLEE